MGNLPVCDWTEGDVRTNGVRLHYYRTGGDKRPMVLSHGITDNGMGWLRVAQALAPDYDVIMVDARGHGQSEKPDDGYAYQNMAVDLAGLIKEMNIVRPALMGHSMGAAVSTILAAIRPEIPECLILEDPALRPIPFTVEQGLASAAKKRIWLPECKSKTREELKAECRRDLPDMREVEPEHWVDSVYAVSMRLFDDTQVEPSYSYTPWQELVAKIACPILLITGDPERGALTPPEGAQMATKIWKSGTVAHFPNSGHVIRRDNYHGYIKVVKAWLAEHYPSQHGSGEAA